MTRDEITQAKELLDDYTERYSTATTEAGQSLTAYWVDGGQRVFDALYQVVGWIAERKI